LISSREEELGGRIEVLDKLRTTLRELEREKKETAKRYREQVSTKPSLKTRLGSVSRVWIGLRDIVGVWPSPTLGHGSLTASTSL